MAAAAGGGGGGWVGLKRHLFVIYNGESMETFATALLPQTSFCCSSTFPSRRPAAGKKSERSMFEYNEKEKKLSGENRLTEIGIAERSERQLRGVSEQFSGGICAVSYRAKKSDHVWIFGVLVSNEKEAD